ncbi:hypothetical protein QQS21_003315 [Conoideocrella luteorostrata]|uniref:Uncharacterized protein n=1 Tax=Conoideocrella luteorostrata TaxID=1105319 RepID=A0AAJ0CXL5_9HYPO|nr:hypothetical protein QQS21_003315 [Conoideocrella luteorostrata]
MSGSAQRPGGRRLSRSLPLPLLEKPHRRFTIGRSLQHELRKRQTRISQILSPFIESPAFKDGKERRRRAHDPQDSCSCSDQASPSTHSPLGTDVTSSLAQAGMLMATEDLDRLSEMARENGERQ